MSPHPADGNVPVNLRPVPADPGPPAGPFAATPPALHPEHLTPGARLRRHLQRMLKRPASPRVVLRALTVEQHLIDSTRSSSTISYGEAVLHSLGAERARRVLRRTQRGTGRLARRTDRRKARSTRLRARAERSGEIVVSHPDGGVQTVAETVSDLGRQRAAIEAVVRQGSRLHQRLPGGLRRVPALVFLADALLLLYFFSGVTDVDWSNPVSMPLAFAVLLAAMVTGISFAFFRFAGDRLKQYKNESGTVPLRGLDEATMVAMLLALLAIAVLAALMFTRMYTEVTEAYGSGVGSTAIVIGVVLATVDVLANCLVVAVHALDGSTESGRMDALGKAVAPSLRRAKRQRDRACLIDSRTAVLIRKADRAAAAGITEAGYRRAEADRLTDAARAVHQGTGPLSEPMTNPNERSGVLGHRDTEATLKVDERAYRLTLDHLHTPLGREQAEDSGQSAA